MTCRYGKYYISRRGQGRSEFEIEERNGYIVDEKFGFTKDREGIYIVTDIESGVLIPCSMIPCYSLIQAYRDAAKWYACNADNIAKWKRNPMAMKLALLVKSRKETEQ